VGSADEIGADFAAVRDQPAAKIASDYQAFTRLALPADAIDRLLDQRVDDFVQGLEGRRRDFERFPDRPAGCWIWPAPPSGSAL